MFTLEDAINIAVKAHKGQKDKAYESYILHPLHVMMQMDTDTERIVAVLHDVTEDSDITLLFLKHMGITEEISLALFALDKNNFNSYDEMIAVCKLNPIARKVKLADLEHNMTLKRTLGREEMNEKDKERIAKYYKSWIFLKGE